MSKENEMQQQQKVREMAQLSLLNNTINEIQEKNLKMYPLVFFNGVDKVVVDYNFSHDNAVEVEENTKDVSITYKFKQANNHNFRVSYHLDIDLSADNGSLEKRFEAIENSVRNLFWRSTKVQVFFNEKLVFESKHVGK